MAHETAVLGGGCFWCTEAIYKCVLGVNKVEPGYAGGHIPNPTYHQVCGGNTGHAEVIRIEYDPGKISYSEILEIFWLAHDPTTRNRQGNDIGPQYRSIILTADAGQLAVAKRSRSEADASGAFRQPVVTEIQQLDVFYPAENYHHDYFAINPNQPYCRAIISPKLKHFMQANPKILK